MSRREFNGRACPYFARCFRVPGYDPDGICNQGCREEPACMTDEPLDGWPMRKIDARGGWVDVLLQGVVWPMSGRGL